MSYDIRHNGFEGYWQEIINKYAELASQVEDRFEDAAHWYGEQANTSLLSTAAWMCGFPNLCEMSELKRVYTGRRGAPRYSYGRIDMFLYLDGDRGTWIEAKKVSGSMDLSVDSDYPPTEARLLRWLNTAYDASGQNRLQAQADDGLLCSLVFCSFWLSSTYYGRGRRRSARIERANYAVNQFKEVTEMDGENSYFAAFFNTDSQNVWESGHRPFGLGVLGYIEEA